MIEVPVLQLVLFLVFLLIFNILLFVIRIRWERKANYKKVHSPSKALFGVGGLINKELNNPPKKVSDIRERVVSLIGEEEKREKALNDFFHSIQKTEDTVDRDVMDSWDGVLSSSQSNRESGDEIRTTSSTGGQKGVKPERYSLIPVPALDIMARLYGFGAEKYAAHNWRKGYEWSKSFDSLFRHATAALNGEDIDEETGLPHLAGAAFHCFTLMVFMQEHPEFDDRWKRNENIPKPDETVEEPPKDEAVNRTKVRDDGFFVYNTDTRFYITCCVEGCDAELEYPQTADHEPPRFFDSNFIAGPANEWTIGERPPFGNGGRTFSAMCPKHHGEGLRPIGTSSIILESLREFPETKN